MSVTRQAVMRAVAASTDADGTRTTTVESLAERLGAREAAVRTHLEALSSCALVVEVSDGRFRVSRTGEELVSLGLDEGAVIDPGPMTDA